MRAARVFEAAPLSSDAVRARRQSKLPWVVVLALGILSPASATAEPSKGEVLFKEGLVLLEDAERTKDRSLFDQACDRFARSFAEEELLNPLIHLARCEEGRGQLRAALKGWRAAASLAKAQSDAPAQVLAENAAKTIEGKLPKVLVRVPPPARAATLDVDGEAVTESQPFAVDPGPHKVRARLGDRIEEKDVVVQEGTVEVALLASEPKPINSPSGVDLAIPGWVFLGVAGAAWIGTAATSAVYVTRCDAPFECPENAFGGGLAEANLALWIAAPVLTAVGATLLIVDATSEPGQPSATVGATSWVGANAAGIELFGKF